MGCAIAGPSRSEYRPTLIILFSPGRVLDTGVKFSDCRPRRLLSWWGKSRRVGGPAFSVVSPFTGGLLDTVLVKFVLSAVGVASDAPVVCRRPGCALVRVMSSAVASGEVAVSAWVCAPCSLATLTRGVDDGTRSIGPIGLL